MIDIEIPSRLVTKSLQETKETGVCAETNPRYLAILSGHAYWTPACEDVLKMTFPLAG